MPLARSDVCLQGFRLGDFAWGLQFHCEVTREMVASWADEFESAGDVDRTGYDGERMRADTPRHIEQWNAIGREISSRFLTVAERAGNRLSHV